ILIFRFGRPFRRNPWRAGTLEWAMPTPPTSYSFASLPIVDRRADLLEPDRLGPLLACGKGYLGFTRNNRMELLGVDIVGGQPEQVVILPHRTFHPLVAALATGAFFLFFLFKLYWLTPVALAAVIVVFLAWTRDTALSGDMELLAIGHGQALPWHLQAERPPSWWAMVFTIVADMTAYVSLLFGSLFLWVSAPNWPPQQSLEIGTATPFAALAALGTVALAGRMAAVAGRRRSGWLALAILA